MSDFIPAKITLALITIFISACASFAPGMRYQDLIRPRQPTARAVQEGLDISVEEFATESKSRQAFDADLASSGVLPLLIRIENRGDQSFRIRENEIQVFLGGSPLTQLIGGEASDQSASSEYAGKAFLWTMAAGPFAILLWPSTIAASATHTHGVNRKIRQHFESLQFVDMLVKPNQVAAGFVYFKLPDGTKSIKDLAVAIEPVREQDGTRLPYRLDLTSK